MKYKKLILFFKNLRLCYWDPFIMKRAPVDLFSLFLTFSFFSSFSYSFLLCLCTVVLLEPINYLHLYFLPLDNETFFPNYCSSDLEPRTFYVFELPESFLIYPLGIYWPNDRTMVCRWNVDWNNALSMYSQQIFLRNHVRNNLILELSL